MQYSLNDPEQIIIYFGNAIFNEIAYCAHNMAFIECRE